REDACGRIEGGAGVSFKRAEYLLPPDGQDFSPGPIIDAGHVDRPIALDLVVPEERVYRKTQNSAMLHELGFRAHLSILRRWRAVCSAFERAGKRDGIR